MSIATTAPVTFRTVADLMSYPGGIPLERIRLWPVPGTATEADVLAVLDHENVPCELIDGVLVEKTVGYYESRVAIVIVQRIENFLEQNDLGIALTADGTLRIAPGQVRIPDVSFISWLRLPNRKLPAEPIPALVPDLAVEVLSVGNTPAEMQRKLRDYFTAGTRLVWFVDPRPRTATVFTGLGEGTPVAAEGVLEGGMVLPGFTLSLPELFRRAGQQRRRGT